MSMRKGRFQKKEKVWGPGVIYAIIAVPTLPAVVAQLVFHL
jgi:hypothetical protein